MSVAVLAGTAAMANVNLEFRPGTIEGVPGETVEIGLYAVSDDGADQAFFGGQMIVTWDSDLLELVGTQDDGPYTWLASYFPDDSGGDGLNTSFTDGDAWYMALARFDALPVATDEGLLITTFLFEVVGDEGTSMIEMPEQLGDFTTTAVLHPTIPGSTVTGTLGTAMVMVGDVEIPMGDFDGDSDVDLVDFGHFHLCYSGANQDYASGCEAGDFDEDGDIDMADYSNFQLAYTGTL